MRACSPKQTILKLVMMVTCIATAATVAGVAYFYLSINDENDLLRARNNQM